MSRRTTINYTGDKVPLVTRAFLAIFGGFLAAFIGFSNIASAQGKWAQATPMPTARSEIVAAALDDIIYVVGGLTHQGGLTTFEAFDPATNTWMVLPPIPEPRHHTAIAALNGRIYVTGGFGRSGSGFRSHFSTVLNTTWVYEPVLRQWSEATPMPGAEQPMPWPLFLGKYSFWEASPGRLNQFGPTTPTPELGILRGPPFPMCGSTPPPQHWTVKFMSWVGVGPGAI